MLNLLRSNTPQALLCSQKFTGVASQPTFLSSILEFSALADVATPVVPGGNSRCNLILKETLLKQLLCQKYNRRAKDVCVYSTAKPTRSLWQHLVLLLPAIFKTGLLTQDAGNDRG